MKAIEEESGTPKPSIWRRVLNPDGAAKRNGLLVGLGGVLGGLMIAFAVPAWQTYVVETPNLKIEINSIKNKVAEETLVDLRDYPDLQKVLEDTGPFSRDTTDTDAIPIKRLDQAVRSAQRQISTVSSRIDDMKAIAKNLDSLRAEDLTFEKARELNLALYPEVTFTQSELESAKREKNSQYFSNLLSRFKQAYQDYLSNMDARLQKLRTGIPVASQKLDEIRKKRAIIYVAVALTNSGRSSVSIKERALMRVYIGQGNYVDLDLDVNEYETKAEIGAHGTRVLLLQSSEISQLPLSDQDLINRYWDRSEPAMVFVEDIFGKIHSSSPIPFAEGVYQKIIHDQEAAAASKALYLNGYGS